MNSESLPQPEAHALALSRELQARVLAAIDEHGGWLGFAEYMQLALYEPGLGYYSGGSVKFGPDGDFTTAPEQGDWLASALAAFLSTQFAAPGSMQILELGAGSGRLAEVLLSALADRGHASVDYSILETSADLRARQSVRLGAAGWSVSWLDALPQAPFTGVVLANEVADALPVARFVRTKDQVLPLGVVRDGERLAIAPGPPDRALSDAILSIEAELGAQLPDGYRSEVSLLLGPWLQELFGLIERGGVLLIDYGLSQRDYYRADRTDGTLICHYRQRAHADALLWPGLQDISAWVDFSAVAANARSTGFDLAGYTTQAQFLLETIAGDPELAAREPSPEQASALKTLVLPGEMGERFKLIWLTRGMEHSPLPGRDFRNWL